MYLAPSESMDPAIARAPMASLNTCEPKLNTLDNCMRLNVNIRRMP